MTNSVSGQDEPNPALWLATRAGKMELSCPLVISRVVPQDERSFFGVLFHVIQFIDQARSVFCVFMDLDLVSVHKHAKKNLANIQPS